MRGVYPYTRKTPVVASKSYACPASLPVLKASVFPMKRTIRDYWSA
ncbi:MAG TPA: hypothetical protein PLZ53_03545 [Candidatus Hydrogenedentes bacterium]|nr:hypothetical protein [Candidatus Hydrogenedentota bacterium]HOH42165.1 hypothetical protein [Candidatus Hydrogenedentota bacterium]HOM48035.1 hypothetical protein [Candidatus Hydrogenedentota bacterium]HPX85313.1 hypothetical protein [Candidatus Hydrogenedentota bacterium]